MAKTNDLRKAITSLLSTYCDNVYYKKAKNNADYPYVTYYISKYPIESISQYDLEIHVWAKDVKLAENIADMVDNGLNETIYRDSKRCFSIDLNSRFNVEDEDKSIEHIVLRFNLRHASKKG